MRCSHGKSLDDDCRACEMMDRIEEKKDNEIQTLRNKVAILEAEVKRLKKIEHYYNELAPK